ncbi:hypothetical protein KGY79_13365 [Candidatus Bipolaricaulota bacterium]|nr:hypothetical protein [Candidatus Bipolaricaulota bacterium]
MKLIHPAPTEWEEISLLRCPFGDSYNNSWVNEYQACAVTNPSNQKITLESNKNNPEKPSTKGNNPYQNKLNNSTSHSHLEGERFADLLVFKLKNINMVS